MLLKPIFYDKYTVSSKLKIVQVLSIFVKMSWNDTLYQYKNITHLSFKKLLYKKTLFYKKKMVEGIQLCLYYNVL